MTLLMAMFPLTACMSCSTGSDEPPTEGTEKNDPSTEPGPNPGNDEQGGNVLVAYFSCSNTTKEIAEEVSAITGGTLFRIEAETPYTSADLDYNSDCRANREQNNPSARPAIKGMPEKLQDYDVIFLG